MTIFCLLVRGVQSRVVHVLMDHSLRQGMEKMVHVQVVRHVVQLRNMKPGRVLRRWTGHAERAQRRHVHLDSMSTRGVMGRQTKYVVRVRQEQTFRQQMTQVHVHDV